MEERNGILSLFPVKKPILGMIHLKGESDTEIFEKAKEEIRLMEEGGRIPSGDEVAIMLDFSRELLITQGYIPYYLYRQKYMSGSLENVGWAKPGTESLYNIVMMEELHTVVSLGAGGVTKLIAPGNILRLTNPKFPQEYLSGFDKVLGQKAQIKTFYAASTQ